MLNKNRGVRCLSFSSVFIEDIQTQLKDFCASLQVFNVTVLDNLSTLKVYKAMWENVLCLTGMLIFSCVNLEETYWCLKRGTWEHRGLTREHVFWLFVWQRVIRSEEGAHMKDTYTVFHEDTIFLWQCLSLQQLILSPFSPIHSSFRGTSWSVSQSAHVENS